MVFIYIVFFILYFSLIGFLSILESKVLGLVQSSSSISSIGVFSIYHYILDFFKMLFNGVVWSLYYNSFLYMFLNFYFMVLVFSVFFLPISKYGVWFYYGFLFFIVLDSSLFLFNIIMLNFFIFNFIDFCNYNVKSVYVYGEVLNMFLYLFLFMIFGFFKICNFVESVGISVGFFIPGCVLLMFFIVLLVSVFNTPFDYLEIESEFVGGVILELHGVLFVIWSLVEYILILNNVIFLCSIVLSIFWFKSNWFILILLVLCVIILIFFSSSKFVSMSFNSYFFILSSLIGLGLVCCICLFLFFCLW